MWSSVVPYFLSALTTASKCFTTEQSTIKASIYICFMLKNPKISLRILLNFQTNLFSKGVKVVPGISHALFSDKAR